MEQLNESQRNNEQLKLEVDKLTAESQFQQDIIAKHENHIEQQKQEMEMGSTISDHVVPQLQQQVVELSEQKKQLEEQHAQLLQ